MPTITNLTSGAGSAATSFNTASVAPTGSRLILVSVHAYISTGSVQPATPTVTGNGITYTLVLSQVADNSGTDRANVFLFCGMATSPSSGAINISFGATTMTRCAWAVDQSDSDIDLSTGTGTGRTNGQCAIAQTVGNVTAGATSLSVSYSPSMRSDSAGYSMWGHQTQEVKTPRTSWTELSDVTSVTLATMETQYFAGTDSAASASWTTSGRAGGIAIEVKKAAPIIWVGAYALQGGTTGLTMTPPSGTQAGDLDIIWVADKNSSVDPTDPGSGWTRIDSQQVGTGADGVGTGLIRLTVWYRILTGTSTSTSVTITGANRSLGGGQVYRLTGAGSFATPTATFGSDTDSSTTVFAAVMATDLAAGVDDYTLSIGAFTAVTALNGRSLTIPNSTQSRYDQIDSAGGAVGNQIFVWTDQRVGMVGTQSGAATTGATSGVGTTGGAVQIKIALAGGTSYPVAQTDDAGLTDSASFEQDKELTDSTGLIDAAVLDRTLVVADSVGLVDGTQFSNAQVQTDSSGLTDAASAGLSRPVLQTDSAGLTDGTLLTQSKLTTDSAGLTDSAPLFQSKVSTDSAGLADSAEFAATLVRTDSTGLTDSASITQSKPLTDSTGLTDTSLVESGKTLGQTDSAGLTDAQAFSQTHLLTDSAGLTDTPAQTISKPVTDSAGLIDSANLQSGRDITDSAGLADATLLFRATALSDLVGLADAAALSQLTALTDDSGLTDAFSVGDGSGITPRPNTGTTGRPSTGRTARPYSGTTTRP